MEVKDAYKLKRFGTYCLEIDSDDGEKIKKFIKKLKRAIRFRFIKFVVVPKGIVELKELKGGSKNGNKDRKD